MNLERHPERAAAPRVTDVYCGACRADAGTPCRGERPCASRLRRFLSIFREWQTIAADRARADEEEAQRDAQERKQQLADAARAERKAEREEARAEWEALFDDAEESETVA